jgi:26 proteasome complex subunit DSS1
LAFGIWLTCTTDWAPEETEAAGDGATKHLWEESWDDDDTSDDFSAQLK